jgi:hypothetical protein
MKQDRLINTGVNDCDRKRVYGDVTTRDTVAPRLNTAP